MVYLEPADIRKQVAALINKVIDGVISENEAIASIEQFDSQDESIIRADHALYHYRDDSNIRERDKGYAEIQVNALRAMAYQLSLGLPLTEKQGYW